MYISFFLRYPPTPTPDASQWNIGGVGPFGVGAGVGHVHSMFFVLISFAFCSQREPSFQWNMGFKIYLYYKKLLAKTPFFHKYFLNMDISVINESILTKFSPCVDNICIERMVS